MARNSIAALILTYNDYELTANLCKNLLAQNEVSQIVIVDNSDSADIQIKNSQSLPLIAKNIAYIKAPSNDGYAAGNNIGIRYILDNTDAAYIWIINNDIIPQKNAAISMVEELQLHDNKAVCGSVLLYYNETGIIDDNVKLQCYGGGAYYPALGKTKLVCKNLPLSAVNDTPVKKVDFIMGASLMVHRNIFRDIGLMPEEYFMYFEETDWQTLAKKYDYKVIVATQSLVFHLDSLSTKNKKHSFYYFLNRSAIIFTKKYYVYYLPSVLLFRSFENIVLVPGFKNKVYSIRGLVNGLIHKKLKTN